MANRCWKRFSAAGLNPIFKRYWIKICIFLQFQCNLVEACGMRQSSCWVALQPALQHSLQKCWGTTDHNALVWLLLSDRHLSPSGRRSEKILNIFLPWETTCLSLLCLAVTSQKYCFTTLWGSVWVLIFCTSAGRQAENPLTPSQSHPTLKGLFWSFKAAYSAPSHCRSASGCWHLLKGKEQLKKKRCRKLGHKRQPSFSWGDKAHGTGDSRNAPPQPGRWVCSAPLVAPSRCHHSSCDITRQHSQHFFSEKSSSHTHLSK